MPLVRIADVKPLDGRRVEMTLTTGEVVQRELGHLLIGPVFDEIRGDDEQFRQVKAEDGSLVWPGGVDLCPDVVIWGGLPPESTATRAA
jgi:hypothetical protein